MPKDGAQPRAVENLRNWLREVDQATSLFDVMVKSTGEYFRSPERRRRNPDDMDSRLVVEVGEEYLPNWVVLVRRRTMDLADSGEFIIPTDEWERRRDGVQQSYQKWAAALQCAIDAANGLRTLRTRLCPSLPDQWFMDLLRDLRELLAMRSPDTYQNGSSFWKFRSDPLPHRAEELIAQLHRADLNLADVIPAPTDHRITPHDVLKSVGRETVALHDLPVGMGPGHLRAADERGWIWVQCWAGNRESESAMFRENPVGPPYSPCEAPPSAGDCGWDTLFWNIAPPWSPSPRVRLREKGLAELDKIEARRRGEAKVNADDGEPATSRAYSTLYSALVAVEAAAREWRAPPPESLSLPLKGDLTDGWNRMQSTVNRSAHREKTRGNLAQATDAARDAAPDPDTFGVRAALDSLIRFLEPISKDDGLVGEAESSRFDGLIGSLGRIREQVTGVELPGADQARRTKVPSERAWKAWRLKNLAGITSQTEIAEKMTAAGHLANQGQVSRWLKEADAFLAAGGVAPPIEAAAPATSVDPRDIEMGERQDRHSRHQREQPDEETDTE